MSGYIFLSMVVFGLAGMGYGGVLYENSFEGMAVGPLVESSDGEAVWRGAGNAAEVVDTHHHTGAKALHLRGGAEVVLTVSLGGSLRQARGLRFQGERWTSRAPFAFRLEVLQGGDWQPLATLDDIMITGRSFLTEVALALPPGGVDGLRFFCTAPDDTGVLLDDFVLLDAVPDTITRAISVTQAPIARLLTKEDLFLAGTHDTHTFRIPALLTALNGDLLACCDARRESGKDLNGSRDIDIVVRRSSDNGVTWSPMEVICDYGYGRPASDPSLVLDRTTGEIFCFYNYMDRDNADREYRLFVQSSKDNGRTWGVGRDITDQIAPPEWKRDFKFITSGRGIQRQSGELVHTLVNIQRGLHLFSSTDHGASWQLSSTAVKPADESKVMVLADGSLMINSRVNGAGYRWVHRSTDSGTSWTSAAELNLIDPGCNASIIRCTSTAAGDERNRLLFCNANSRSGRKNLVARVSYDEGLSWSDGKVLDSGFSGYSSMTLCADGTVGVLYEPGNGVRFIRFTLADLTDGKDSLPAPFPIR